MNGMTNPAPINQATEKQMYEFTLTGPIEDNEGAFIEWITQVPGGSSLLLRINSTGGDISSALAMAAAINQFYEGVDDNGMRGDITAHVLGDALSAAFILVQACDWRIAEPSSHFIMHPIAINAICNPSEFKAMLHHIDHEVLALTDIVAKRACVDLDEEKAARVRQSIANSLYGSGPVLSGSAQEMYFMGMLDEVRGLNLPARADIIAQQQADAANVSSGGEDDAT